MSIIDPKAIDPATLAQIDQDIADAEHTLTQLIEQVRHAAIPAGVTAAELAAVLAIKLRPGAMMVLLAVATFRLAQAQAPTPQPETPPTPQPDTKESLP